MLDLNHHELFNEDFLGRVEREDLDALCRLDRGGILCGSQECGLELGKRLRCFKGHVSAMESELSRSGRYDCEGLVVSSRERIGRERFRDIASKTESLYKFSIDWVPGFYINPPWGMLFGGCAFCQYPDFFTLFIIRRSFRRSSRWLIYNREELLAHELCHVARVGIESQAFEESFAYQTSSSGFRRLLGGMFYRQSDSFLFLGVSFLLLLAQVLRTYFVPWIPIWPFWVLLAVVFGGLFLRQGLGNRTMRRALARVSLFFGSENGWPVLFRCTDEELHALSRLPLSKSSVSSWIQDRSVSVLRWRIILHRFGGEEVSP